MFNNDKGCWVPGYDTDDGCTRGKCYRSGGSGVGADVVGSGYWDAVWDLSAYLVEGGCDSGWRWFVWSGLWLW